MFKKILLIFLLLLIMGCEQKDNSTYAPIYSNSNKISKTTYILGIHPLHNPKRLFEVYQPLVDLINSKLDNVELKLEASRNYAAYDEKLFSGYFDFSLPNPYQTVKSLDHGYKVFGKMGDDKSFRGIILVRKDSGIKEISDLKGKVVSYPAPTALAATMMPQWYMYKHGIDISKDITNNYVGSQESSIMNVYLKKSDAASTWPPPWRAFIKERPEIAKEVEVKWTTEFLPNNGLVVKKDIPDKLLKEISDIFFNLHKTKIGLEILKPMELSKFEKADEATYKNVKEFLINFEKEVGNIRDER
ncbi:MAG: phosphate/phosphite/phosphonate ABC transporter substrate-binding protein [Campylobacterota bacterium]|nr:phosphate/phosphite/phosphonate ABC transporter substrate-binding protein [Campylobacterota bacterium]